VDEFGADASVGVAPSMVLAGAETLSLTCSTEASAHAHVGLLPPPAPARTATVDAASQRAHASEQTQPLRVYVVGRDDGKLLAELPTTSLRVDCSATVSYAPRFVYALSFGATVRNMAYPWLVKVLTSAFSYFYLLTTNSLLASTHIHYSSWRRWRTPGS